MVAEQNDAPDPGEVGARGGGSYFDGFLNFVGNPNFPPGRPNMNPRVQGYEAGPYSAGFATSPRGWEPPRPPDEMEEWEWDERTGRRVRRRPLQGRSPGSEMSPAFGGRELFSRPESFSRPPPALAPWEVRRPDEDDYAYKSRIEVGRMKLAENELRNPPVVPFDWNTARELAAQNISGKYPGLEAWAAEADARIGRAREEQAMGDFPSRTVTPMSLSFDMFSATDRARNPFGPPPRFPPPRFPPPRFPPPRPSQLAFS